MVDQEQIWNIQDSYNKATADIEALELKSYFLWASGSTDEIKAKAKQVRVLASQLKELEYNWYLEELGKCKKTK